MASIFTVPVVASEPHQSLFVNLDGRRFRLDLNWNGRVERWSISVYAADDTPVVLNKGLRLGGDVLRSTRYKPSCPQGVLSVVDPTGLAEAPTLDSLGSRHYIIFVPLDDAEIIANG